MYIRAKYCQVILNTAPTHTPCILHSISGKTIAHKESLPKKSYLTLEFQYWPQKHHHL